MRKANPYGTWTSRKDIAEGPRGRIAEGYYFLLGHNLFFVRSHALAKHFAEGCLSSLRGRIHGETSRKDLRKDLFKSCFFFLLSSFLSFALRALVYKTNFRPTYALLMSKIRCSRFWVTCCSISECCHDHCDWAFAHDCCDWLLPLHPYPCCYSR